MLAVLYDLEDSADVVAEWFSNAQGTEAINSGNRWLYYLRPLLSFKPFCFHFLHNTLMAVGAVAVITPSR